MINEIKDHFILIDKCASQTRIAEIKKNTIIRLTIWQDQNPPLIGRIFEAKIIKKLNGGMLRATINNKKTVTVKVGQKRFNINEKIKIIITSEEFDDKPIQAKLSSNKDNFENLSDIQRIIHLYFDKNIPVIEDNYAVYWDTLDLDSVFFDALKPKVKIEGGGILWIEKTKAATLIDIDTNDLLIKNEEQMLNFCKKAFLKCINEIKLRNVGGMIIIDFPRITSYKKNFLHEYIVKLGKKTLIEANFFGFSRLQLYEMYMPRNFKSLESFYVNKEEYDFQNHLRSLWRTSKGIKSKRNICFFCGKNLYKKLKCKKIPDFVNIIERTDFPSDHGEITEIKI